jgi:hypothetical protein
LASWIRICIQNADPDPGVKSAETKKKKQSQKTENPDPDLDPDPHPHSVKSLYPDPHPDTHRMNADPKNLSKKYNVQIFSTYVFFNLTSTL